MLPRESLTSGEFDRSFWTKSDVRDLPGGGGGGGGIITIRIT